MLCGCVERALASGVPGGAGVGVDVELLEDAARGLARLGLSQEGRAALKAAKAVRRLVAIARVDSEALEAVIARRCVHAQLWLSCARPAASTHLLLRQCVASTEESTPA